jgi:hypothetical protein
MKITHPTPQIPPRDNHGGPKGSAQASTGDTTTDGTTPTDPAVNVDLSADAQGVIATGKGNSANSPAHQAMNYLADFAGTADFKNFGQLVSQIARGILPGEPAPAGDEPAADGTGPVIDDGTTTQAPVIIDEPIVVEEPVIVVDEPVVVEEPIAEEPVIVVDEPVVVEEPVAEEPVIVVDEPIVVEEPVAEEPVVVVDEPVVVEEPVAEEPVIVVDEPVVVEEPVAEEPVIVVDEPIITVEEPVVTDAELIDEITPDTPETV